MDRIIIEYDNARITRAPDGLVDVETYDGRIFKGLEARRLFPITGRDRYITLLDSDENEVAVVRDMNNLMDDSREALGEALDEYYLVPKITKILECYIEHDLLKMRVETDRGEYRFDLKNHHVSVRPLYDGRVLIKDTSDDRYEIPDFNKLDKASRRLFASYL